MNANYISVSEFTAQQPEIDISQYDTATVSGMISKASRYIDNFCQANGFDFEAVVGEKSDAIITNDGDLKIWTRKFPIENVTEITLKRGTFSLNLGLTSGGNNIWDLPEPKSYILYPNTYLTATGTFTMNDLRSLRAYNVLVSVSYTGGYQTIPEPIKQACILLTKDILSKRLNTAGASSISQGGISIKFGERDGQSDDVVDAQALLQDYVRVVPI